MHVSNLQGKRARIAERTDGYAAKIAAEERELAAKEKAANLATTRAATEKASEEAPAEAPENGAEDAVGNDET